MKTLIATLLLAGALSAQSTITVTIASIPPGAMVDLFTHWTDQTLTAFGTAPAIDAATSPITITVTQPVAAPIPAVGSVVLIEGEPMGVAAVSGANLTLVRNLLPPLTPLVSHAAGAYIYPLRYTTPFLMLQAEALRPYLLQVITGLGVRSASLGATVTGAVTGTVSQ
jgi:hypothetical protein